MLILMISQAVQIRMKIKKKKTNTLWLTYSKDERIGILSKFFGFLGTNYLPFLLSAVLNATQKIFHGKSILLTEVISIFCKQFVSFTSIRNNYFFST